MRKYCLALDLKNDEQLIAEYEAYHKSVWPEIIKGIYAAGINNMEIYRVENRLFMIIQTSDDFSFEKKTAMDISNDKVKEWEALMWKYQQPIPNTKTGEKWRLMKEIFSLNAE